MSSPVPGTGSEVQVDPVTLEVLKNAFKTAVDEMAEQVLRTCYSFVIYAKDFSSAICDRHGNTVMQGSYDIAVHVGTLHFTAKAVLEMFADDINPGDVFVMNDPYIGGTHLNDVRFLRPIFHDGDLVAMAQCNGHWSDVGGSVPGSHDITARDCYVEGVRITPLKIVDGGVFRADVARMIVSNTRTPTDCAGDLKAQLSATVVAESEVLRLIDKYGKDTVLAGFEAVQDYVEKIVRTRVAELPDGTWVAEDHLDFDPDRGEGLVPVRVAMTIDGDDLRYDLTGSHPAVRSALNSAFGMSYSGVVAGTKTFFPDIPLNSGLYRAIDVELGPPGTVVNAQHPTPVTGFNAGAYEKIMNCTFSIWSRIWPERALACSYNLEYLLVGGKDERTGTDRDFMWYDWMMGGWGGRNGRDGFSATSPLFGAALEVQPVEGQERLSPILTSQHELVTDSGGPGRWRGGLGAAKGATLTAVSDVRMSYSCDRARSVTWGVEGGLPSVPHGVWLTPDDTDETTYLGAWFADRALSSGDSFVRPSAGGGGYGDPLTRDPQAVCADVADDRVSMKRAALDYGVVIREVDADLASYAVDDAATRELRARIARERHSWLNTDPEEIAQRYRADELDVLDLVRQYGVIVDWGTGEVLPRTTEQFREMFRMRAAANWLPPESFAPENEEHDDE